MSELPLAPGPTDRRLHGSGAGGGAPMRDAMPCEPECAGAAEPLPVPVLPVLPGEREPFRGLDGDRAPPGGDLGELIAAHTGFVLQIARRYRTLGVPREDLVAAGHLGLIEAARRYDAAHGARFITYAAFWIRKAMLDALDAQASVVRIPSYQRRRERGDGGRVPSYFVTTVSLDEPCGDDPSLTLASRISDPASLDPESEAQREQHVARLRAALDHLPARDRFVVVRSFGLDGEPAWSRQKVGRVVGLSRERVRQIECAALDRLRRAIARPTRRPAAPAP